MDFILFVMIVLLAMPSAVVLSVWIGDFGCGQPISTRELRRGTISLAQTKRPASLASVAEEVTNFMICDRVRMCPLKVVTGMSSESMIWAPALLRALLTLR